jgi:hypothetical protein
MIININTITLEPFTFHQQEKYKKYKISSSSAFLPVLNRIDRMVHDNPENLTGPEMTSILFVTAEYILPIVKRALSNLDDVTPKSTNDFEKHCAILKNCFDQLKLPPLYHKTFIGVIYPKIQALLRKDFKARHLPTFNNKLTLDCFYAYYTATSGGLNQSVNHSLLRWLSKSPKILR